MLWERWIPKSYLSKPSVCGVECVYDDKGIIFNFSILSIEKNKIESILNGQTNEISEVCIAAKKANAPVILSIVGKGIILKKILFSENDSLVINDLIKQHLPTINPNEFYVEFYKNDLNSGYLSVCRKEQLNDILTRFSNEKTESITIFLGPLSCNSLSVITSSCNHIFTSLNRIELSNGFIDSISPREISSESSALSLDGIKIEPSQMVSFASGFSYLTNQIKLDSNDSLINNLLNKHIEKLKIRVLLFTFIAITFIISSINSVLFFQKFEDNSSLDIELNLYESKHSQITQLLDNYQKKKSLIEQAGVFENKKLSVFADKIAASLPTEVVLRELYFNPEIGETDEDSLTNFQQNQLIIKGNCNKSLTLNEWVTLLKNQNFVKSVNLESFILNSQGYTPNFTLKIETE